MRSLKLPNQYFRILRINTEQPSDPKAGYSRSELKHVDLICNLVDGALGEYETRIAALLDDQSADARLARLDGGKPEEVQLKVQQIQDVCNQGIEEVDTELGMVESEIVLEDDQFTWWKKNWESRDSFNGFTSARKAVFAIDKAFESAEVLKVEASDGERKVVSAEKPKNGKGNLRSVK